MYNFSAIDSFLTEIEESYGIPSGSFEINLGRERLYDRVFGFSDYERKRPASPEDRYWFYSCTKIYTCTAAMQLIERGLLDLDAPVSRYLPEYADVRVKSDNGGEPVSAKNTMTVYDLFTMTAGLNYDLGAPPIREMYEKTGGMGSTRDVARAIAKIPLEFEPGTHFNYSLCHDVLAAIIEVVSGMEFGEYVRRNIFEPLGASTLTFRPSAEELEKLAAQYRADDVTRKPMPMREQPFILTKRHESGGAGLFGCAKDCILLPEALANGGCSRSGVRILTPQSIAELSKDRLTGAQRTDYLSSKGKEYGFGLGVRTRILCGDAGVPVGEFGWDGAAGSYYMIDPVNHLSLFYCQHIHNLYCYFDTIQSTLRDLTYKALGLDTIKTE